jgi:hypothetical protein
MLYQYSFVGGEERVVRRRKKKESREESKVRHVELIRVF